MATQNGLNLGLSGSIGTGRFVGDNMPTLISPVLGVATATSLQFSGNNGIIDSAGNEILSLSPQINAVNYLSILNSASGNDPTLTVSGADADIGLTLASKGGRGVAIQGAKGGNAIAGYVGETADTGLTGLTAFTTSNTPQNMISIVLPAGDWDIYGIFIFSPLTSITTLLQGALSLTSGVLSPVSSTAQIYNSSSALNASTTVVIGRVTVGSSSTLYFVGSATFTVTSPNFSAGMVTRRAR